jgi:hypothetical protein
MSERLTANRAPFGQKPAGLRIGVVAALAPPDKLLAPEAAASVAVAATVRKASRRLNWEE